MQLSTVSVTFGGTSSICLKTDWAQLSKMLWFVKSHPGVFPLGRLNAPIKHFSCCRKNT